MSILNLGKFVNCLGVYKEYCDRTLWTRDEISKFYFANLINRRIHLSTQSPKMIYEICNRLQEKDYYSRKTKTRIAGIQFLPGTGNESFSEPVVPQDAELFRDLRFLNWTESDLRRASVSLNGLSGWLGTILPDKFMPVTSGQFRHTISYLFDLELKIYQESDFEYFMHAQKHFLLTKKRLKEFNLDSLYLNPISEYLRIAFPKSLIKKQYEEHDWNWITQDFHLFIYREVLGLDSVASMVSENKRTAIPGNAGDGGFASVNLLNIFVP